MKTVTKILWRQPHDLDCLRCHEPAEYQVTIGEPYPLNLPLCAVCAAEDETELMKIITEGKP